MACALARDPSLKCDFLSKTGTKVTVKVAATGNARFVDAKFNQTDLPVQNGDTVTFTVGAGKNKLDFVIAVADPNDTIRILEDCGGGQTQEMDNYQNDPADPVTGYTICGS
jgi:hypothetical protein